MKTSRILGALGVCVAGLAYSAYDTARQKLAAIESDRLRAGSRVTLTRDELNTYVRQDLAQYFPDGVRDLALDLGSGTATGSAKVDFAKVRRAQGKPPGWLMGRMLEGERPVKVRARVQSGAGRATVNVEDVEISGMTIDGPVLDYLIQNYLRPNYPAAKIGEPFELGHRIDRLEISPSAVHVVIGK